MRSRLVCAICVIAFALSGCSQAGKKLVGTWRSEETKEKITFEERGYYERSGEGYTFGGAYKVDGNKLILQLKVPSSSGSSVQFRDEEDHYTFTITKDTLTLTKRPEPNVTYSRPAVTYKRVE